MGHGGDYITRKFIIRTVRATELRRICKQDMIPKF
jgi:hypothetical protein